jgi:O-antigen/teichoic acid export membrane protein
MVAWRAATRILGLVSTLILVRLLAPSDFGLVTLAMSCVLIVDAVSFIGVEDSLVREKAPSRAMLDTAFTLNVTRAIVSALVIAALAKPAAAFLGEPDLVPVILLLAASGAIEGFGNIGTVAFRRDMDFEKEFRLQILPRLAAVLLTLVLAVTLRSYWALVMGILLQRVLRTAFSYAMHAYRPRFSLAAWRDLAAFSGWAWAIMLAIQLRGRAESILIGRMLDTSHVGFYDTGREIALLPTSELVQPVCHAAYSGFAESRNTGGHPGEACLRLIAVLVLLSLPAGFGLSAIAAPLVRLAFGPNWLPAIPVIQALGIAGAAAGFGVACNTLMRAHGLMRLTFRITIVSVPIRIALLLICIPIGGLPAAAAGVAVATILGRFGSLLVTFRHFGIRLADLTVRVWRSVLAVAAMAGILWWSGLGWHDAPPDTLWDCAIEIAAAVALGTVVYVGMVLSLWQASGRPAGAEADAIEIARRTLSRTFLRFQAD